MSTFPNYSLGKLSLIFFFFFYALVPCWFGVRGSCLLSPEYSVLCVVAFHTGVLHIFLDNIHPSCFRSSLWSLSFHFHLVCTSCNTIGGPSHDVTIPSQSSFSHLVYDRGNTESFSNVFISLSVQSGEAQRPSTHLHFHHTHSLLNSSCHWPCLWPVQCNWSHHSPIDFAL